MLATFNGTWDWAAIGTLALAIATVISLVFGWKSLRHAQREIELSRQGVEEAHRPVVVPVIIARQPVAASVSSSRHTLPNRPCVIEPSVLVVPVQNIGAGPALTVLASVKPIDVEGNPHIGPAEPQTPGTVAGIGKDQIIPIEIHAHGWQQCWSFDLTLTYEDVAGKKWATVSCYHADEGRYGGVTITAEAVEQKGSSV
jgi:hypothetical protein